MSSKSPAKQFTRTPQHRTLKKQERQSYEFYEPPFRFQSNSLFNELKLKLELALKHNTRLLDENSSLGELANQLRYELKQKTQQFMFWQREAEQLTRRTALDRENLLIEIEVKGRSQEDEVKRWMTEISRLHQEKNNLELEKNKVIDGMKSEFEKELLIQLQNVRSVQSSSKQLYEAQIRNLKENFENQQHELETIKSLEKMEKTRLSDTIRALQSELKHIKHAHEIEQQSLRNQLDNQLQAEKRKLENQKEIELNQFNLKAKRLKKDVIERSLELEHINRKMAQQEELLSIEGAQMRKEKENLLAELKANDMNSKNSLAREKSRLAELNQLEIQNLTKLYETTIDELNCENLKLRMLIECKKSELRDMYDESSKIKDSYGLQNQLLRAELDSVKAKLKKSQLQQKQEMECFKIKIATLIQNDIKAISTYYENQLKSYIEVTADLQRINAEIKARLYNTLLENDESRKYFEIQLSKQKAKVQDFKIKMASIHLEHKEQVSSLSSKVQLTSQTLIRETDHKDKKKAQYEEEKRKFHYLANSKDKEIQQLMAMMQSLKVMHEEELKILRSQKAELRLEVDQAEQALKKYRADMEADLKLREDRVNNLVFSNQKEIQQIKDLEDKLQASERNSLRLKKQVDHLTMINNSIAQQLGLSKGFLENLQLQSSAAIEDERTKLKKFVGANEISIKEHFQDRLRSKERDIQGLQKLLSEKESDIRDLIIKYNALEKRLEMMLQASQKIREFEQKVKMLGMDNNLVKNMAELFKKGF